MGKGILGHLTSRAPAPKPGTPLYKLVQLGSDLNVKVWRATGGCVGGRFDGAPMCVLHNRGAKSGQPRETPLVYLADGDSVVLVASIGGGPKHPAWYHNVKAHPDVEIETRGKRRPMRARVVTDPAEREQLWRRVVELWPAYADYQARTERVIPLIACDPRSP